jgi:hypothetical protein
MSDYTNKPKLVAITQPGDYTVRIRKIRDEDCTFTQKQDPKIKVLMTTQDGLKINDTFFGSTDGAIKRAFAFVATALCIVPDENGRLPLKLPGKTTEELRKFLSLAEGKCIKVTVVQEDVTFNSGEKRTICKVSKFHSIQEEAPNF